MTGPTKATRRAVLLRDGLQCVACGRTVAVEDGNDVRPVAQYSLQHRLARGSGGRSPLVNEAVNLTVLCGTGTTGCHGKAEHDPDWARDRGYRVDSWDSPEMVALWVCTSPGTYARYALDGDIRIYIDSIGRAS